MFCTKCGNTLDDGDLFCPQCGNAVKGIPNEQAESNQSEFDLLMMKAESGDAEAQFALAKHYQEDKGDSAEAVKWYSKAAEQGNADAQFNLGLSYSFGDGVVKDEEEAMRWFQKAAEQGHEQAIAILRAVNPDDGNFHPVAGFLNGFAVVLYVVAFIDCASGNFLRKDLTGVPWSPPAISLVGILLQYIAYLIRKRSHVRENNALTPGQQADVGQVESQGAPTLPAQTDNEETDLQQFRPAQQGPDYSGDRDNQPRSKIRLVGIIFLVVIVGASVIARLVMSREVNSTNDSYSKLAQETLLEMVNKKINGGNSQTVQFSKEFFGKLDVARSRKAAEQGDGDEHQW